MSIGDETSLEQGRAMRARASATISGRAIAVMTRLARQAIRVCRSRRRPASNAVVVWASDFEGIGGEGVLANLVVNALVAGFPGRAIIVVSPYAIHAMRSGKPSHIRAINPFGLPPLTSAHQDNRQTFFTKYIVPFAGACFLRSIAKRRKTMYLNYLPLWNFLLLLLIPRSSVLGPVVGGYPPAVSMRQLVKKPAVLVRGALMPLCYFAGAAVITRKFPLLVLGNPCTYRFFPASYRRNILFSCVNILAARATTVADRPEMPAYDVFFYLRGHPSRHPEASRTLLAEISRLGYKVCVAGDLANVPGVTDKGYVPHERLLRLLVDSASFVCLSDNLFAITTIEALALGVHCFLYSQPALIKATAGDPAAAEVFSRLTILPSLDCSSNAAIVLDYLNSKHALRQAPINLDAYADALRSYLALSLHF